jgi:DNA-binding NarL/FixJ family response regulator
LLVWILFGTFPVHIFREDRVSNRAKFQAAARKLAIETSIAQVTSQILREAAAGVDADLQKLTKVDGSSPRRADAKTNPARSLRPRGLAVARLVAQGKTASEVAASLGITRQAVWKWARRPEVMAEVHRAHTEMMRTPSLRG